MVTAPEFISAPRNFPSSSQRCFTVKPSTSRYHATLATASFTVKPGVRLVNPNPLARAGALAALGFAVFVAGFRAMRLGTAFFDAAFFLALFAMGRLLCVNVDSRYSMPHQEAAGCFLTQAAGHLS